MSPTPEHPSPSPHPHHLRVAVLTTAGAYPTDGYDDVPENQPIKVQLRRAATALGLTNTTDWIATAGGRELDLDQSYASNGLSGTVDIDYHPRETGGGTAS